MAPEEPEQNNQEQVEADILEADLSIGPTFSDDSHDFPEESPSERMDGDTVQTPLSLVGMPDDTNYRNIEGLRGSEDIISMAETLTRNKTPDQLDKARRRQELYLQKRREKKKRKVVFHRFRVLMQLIMTVVMIVGLYHIMWLPYWQFPQSHFKLDGNHLLKRQDIVRFVAPLDKKPIFLINPAKLEQAITQGIPLVGKTYVRRRIFPVGVDISVVEKPTWGLLYATPPLSAEQQIALSAGNTIEKVNTTQKTPFIKPLYLMNWDNTLTDLSAYNFTADDLVRLQSPVPLVSSNIEPTTLKPDNLQRYREMASFLNSQPQKAHLLYIDVSNPYDLMAQFDGFKVRLGRADSTLMPRLSRLFPLIPAIHDAEKQIAFVDLRWNQQIVFKKKTPEQIAQEKQQAEALAKANALAEKKQAEAALHPQSEKTPTAPDSTKN